MWSLWCSYKCAVLFWYRVASLPGRAMASSSGSPPAAPAAAAAAEAREGSLHYAQALELPNDIYDGWWFHFVEISRGEWTMGFRAVFQKQRHGPWWGTWVWTPHYRGTKLVSGQVEPASQPEESMPNIWINYEVLPSESTGLETMMRTTSISGPPAIEEEDPPKELMALKKRRYDQR